MFPEKQQTSSIVTNNSDIPVRQDILRYMCIGIEQRTILPKLDSMNLKELQLQIDRVNDVIAGIPTDSLEVTAALVYAAAKFVCEAMEPKPCSTSDRQCSPWKMQLLRKLSKLRKELSQAVALSEGRLRKRTTVELLWRKFNFDEVDMYTVIEILKQKVTADAHKIHRYDNRILQLYQNRLFWINPKHVFQNNVSDMDVPEANSALDFWKVLWERNVVHNCSAEWMDVIESELCSLQQQANLTISMEHVQSSLKHMCNWKAPSVDLIHAFWWKKFSAIHERLPDQLQKVLEGSVPNWMVTGRTTLIQKVKSRGSIPSNFRPITCLPIIWKLLTSILAKVVYQHLSDNEFLFAEQKGCQKGAREH